MDAHTPTQYYTCRSVYIHTVYIYMSGIHNIIRVHVDSMHTLLHNIIRVHVDSMYVELIFCV